ncbi:MAG: OadG family protein, partial [Deltaproteobacteria bacterium]|nr:OadG family protein [Deltaproteobacteria bacterium]
MAYTGAIIVFIGLVVLSFVISQLNKVLNFWENFISKFKQNNKAKQTDELEDEDTFVVPHHLPSDIKEAAGYYSHLIEDLDQPFELTRLYEISQQKGFPRPHIT